MPSPTFPPEYQMNQDQPEITRSGFVGILGRPNVGKSTLLNRLLGQKIAITSPKPQTTRNRVAGVVNHGAVQLVLFDTPGVHDDGRPINRYMVREAMSVVPEVDVVVFLVDGAAGLRQGDKFLATALASLDRPTILAVNKADLSRAEAAPFANLLPFLSVHLISALTGSGLASFLDDLSARMPEGPAYYPDDMLTDRSERFIAQEFIREKLFELTGEEIPYSIAVSVESWKENEESGVIVIHATIHVERDSQKGIVIGKGGRVLKEVGKRARLDLEALLGTRVFLDLHVTVDKNWTKDPRAMRRFGYEVDR